MFRLIDCRGSISMLILIGSFSLAWFKVKWVTVQTNLKSLKLIFQWKNHYISALTRYCSSIGYVRMRSYSIAVLLFSILVVILLLEENDLIEARGSRGRTSYSRSSSSRSSRSSRSSSSVYRNRYVLGDCWFSSKFNYLKLGDNICGQSKDSS